MDGRLNFCVRTCANGTLARDCHHESVYTKRPCPGCGNTHLLGDDPAELCFRCGNVDNPFLDIRMSIEVGSEDSRDPSRIADGTASFNMGLPGVETVVGVRPDGKPKLAYRPVSNNEVSTARARRHYAERHGLTPVESKTFRAVGGK